MTITRKIPTIFAAAAIAIAPLAAASAAHAAALTNVTATSTGVIGTTGTNTAPITISFGVATDNAADDARIALPSGWTFVATGSSTPPACLSGITVTGVTISSCFATNGPPPCSA